MTRLCVSAAALLFVVTTAGAAPPAPTSSPTVDTIVSDYVAARGGLAKIQSIKTLRQTGHAFAGGGRQAVVTRELKRPGKVRFEFTVQGVTAAFVTNGREGWQVSPFDGDLEAKPMAEDALADAIEQSDIEGPLVDWKAKGHQLELAGREVIAGRDTYKLKLTLKGGGVRYDYIDVKTHYEVRADSTRQFRGRQVQIETKFSGHKKVKGVLFPGTVEVAAVGRPQTLRLVIDTIVVNPPLDDARFERKTPAK
jgi:hypothetical protein